MVKYTNKVIKQVSLNLLHCMKILQHFDFIIWAKIFCGLKKKQINNLH